MQKHRTILFRIILSSCALGLFLLLIRTGQAQEKPEIDKVSTTKPNNWRFIITPYALLASQATDVGTTQLRQSFGDLSSLTNFGFQLTSSVVYKNWTLTADGTYANLAREAAEGPLDINMNIKQLILDLRLGYLVVNRVKYNIQTEAVYGWSLEINAGAKLWKNDVTLDYSVTLNEPPPQLERQLVNNQQWWDPMIGSRARVYFNRVVQLGIYASYGGLDIGNASKYSWDILYTNSFRVSRLLLITTGFRAFKYKRIDPSGDGEIETKVTVVGPLLGLSFVF